VENLKKTYKVSRLQLLWKLYHSILAGMYETHFDTTNTFKNLIKEFRKEMDRKELSQNLAHELQSIWVFI
jgi:hypothetical protein